MEQNGLVSGSVTEIIPGSMYQGRVYTQEVVIDLGNDTEIRVSDASRKCSKEMIGRPKQFGLKGFSIQDIRESEEDEFILNPVDVGLSSGISLLKGRIEDFCYEDGAKSALIVSCSPGEIVLELDADQDRFLDEVQVGDFITAETISEVYLFKIAE